MTKQKTRRPAETFPVIEFIYDELKARKWNMWQLALRMGGDPQRNKLCLELLEADPTLLLGDMAADIARAFGTSTQIWLNLERTWRDNNPLRLLQSGAISKDEFDRRTSDQFSDQSYGWREKKSADLTEKA